MNKEPNQAPAANAHICHVSCWRTRRASRARTLSKNMNPFIFVHLSIGLLAMAVSVPLVRRKIKANPWFGVRIPAAFESEEAWFAINEYGGRLLRLWGSTMVLTAIVGAVLKWQYWFAYNFAAMIVVVGGLGLVLVKISRYARIRKKA